MPYTERYVRWCVRTVDEVIIYLPTQFILKLNQNDGIKESELPGKLYDSFEQANG
ncbi:MAG: hypothetical protein KAW56_00100 [Candidatus Marinimicrobia bacterium]|nr:hypothetical protein [Candidatus Neomarinimicrobiota bacterium]